MNRRGQVYQNWNSDIPAYALDADPIYSTVPFFVGIHDEVCTEYFLIIPTVRISILAGELTKISFILELMMVK